MDNDDSTEEKLFQYWSGWQASVSGIATTKEDRQSVHFRNGHADGCTLKRCAFKAACDHYKATLRGLFGTEKRHDSRRRN